MNQKPYTILFIGRDGPADSMLVTGEIVYASSAAEAELAVQTKNPYSDIVMISQTQNRNACFDKYFALKRRFACKDPVYVITVRNKGAKT